MSSDVLTIRGYILLQSPIHIIPKFILGHNKTLKEGEQFLNILFRSP
jgi:hypothetical protein